METYVIIESDGTTSVIDAIGFKKAIDKYFDRISDSFKHGFSIYRVTHELRNEKDR